MPVVKSYVDGKLVHRVTVPKSHRHNRTTPVNVKSKLRHKQARSDLTAISGAVTAAGLVGGGAAIHYHKDGLMKFSEAVRGKASAGFKSAFENAGNLANATFIYSEKDHIKALPKAAVEKIAKAGRAAHSKISKGFEKVSSKFGKRTVLEAEELAPEVEEAAVFV